MIVGVIGKVNIRKPHFAYTYNVERVWAVN